MPTQPVSSLHHLAYQSTATGLPTEAELEELLVQARDANLQRGLTGMLLYCEGRFMQVLEGSREAVQLIYGRIEQDLRHYDIIKLTDGPIPQRSFSQWSMGFKAVNPEDFKHLAGYLNPTASLPGLHLGHDTLTMHALLAKFLTDEQIRY